MTEIVDGLKVTLAQIQGGGLTHQGKALKFELVNPENQVYQASTELTEEQKAAGNAKKVFTFSMGGTEGTISQEVIPIAQEEQQEAMKSVMQARQDAQKNPQLVVPFVQTGNDINRVGSSDVGGTGGFGNNNTATGSGKASDGTDAGGNNKIQVNTSKKAEAKEQ